MRHNFTSARIHFSVPLPSLYLPYLFHPDLFSLCKSHLPCHFRSSMWEETVPSSPQDPSSCPACRKQNRCVRKWLKFQKAFMPLYVPSFIFYFIFLKVFIEFVTTLLLFYVFAFGVQGVQDLSSLARNQTCTPCVGK